MKIKKYILPTLISLFLIINTVNAGILKSDKAEKMNDNVSGAADVAGIEMDNESNTIGSILSKVIDGFLGFLGIMFVILMVTAGYKWMNAQGNEEKVTEAKDLIQRAVIGLVVTIAAYAITYFVFNKIDFLGGSGGPATISDSSGL